MTEKDREEEEEIGKQNERERERPGALNLSEINLLSRYFCWSRLH